MAAVISPPPVGRLCDSLQRASGRLAALLRRDPDPAARAIGRWNIGETAAHASSSPTHFLAVARGEIADLETIDHVDRSNAEHLASDPERRPRVLAARLERADDELVSYARTVDGDPVVRLFGGVDVPLSTLLAVELGELLVHGDDIARAARFSWRIPRDEAAVALDGLIPLLPAVVDERRARDLRMRCELRIRGGSRAVVEIDRGVLRVEPPSGRPVDCRISADPVTFLLLVFHRVGLIRAIARGGVTAWGRRPWRAARLQTALKTL